MSSVILKKKFGHVTDNITVQNVLKIKIMYLPIQKKDFLFGKDNNEIICEIIIMRIKQRNFEQWRIVIDQTLLFVIL